MEFHALREGLLKFNPRIVLHKQAEIVYTHLREHLQYCLSCTIRCCSIRDLNAYISPFLNEALQKESPCICPACLGLLQKTEWSDLVDKARGLAGEYRGLTSFACSIRLPPSLSIRQKASQFIVYVMSILFQSLTQR